nr:tropomyosin-1-like [Leptinotarsa decemlineata]
MSERFFSHFSHEVNALMAKNEEDVSKLHNKIMHLETDLATKDGELLQERQIKEDLLNQSFAVAQSQDSEQKVKNEKFDKLKDLYVKLRDEHIQKIREKADVEKKLFGAMKSLERLNDLEKDKERLEEEEKRRSEELSTLQKDKELFNMETEILKKSVNDASRERDIVKTKLAMISEEKEEMRKRSEELYHKVLDLEKQCSCERTEAEKILREVVRKSIESSEEIMKNAIHEVDNPALTALTCSPDYLRSLTAACQELMEATLNIGDTDYASSISIANQLSHKLATYILQGRATCNTSPDIMFGESKYLSSIFYNVLICSPQ